MAQKYFATINPGLEDALLQEVRELGGKRATSVAGGVEFDATHSVFYTAAYQLRCANRLWLRVDEFRARDAPELYNKTARLDWARLIPADVPVTVRAVAHNSRLHHTDRIARAVSDGIDASLGREESGDLAPLTVLARMVEDRCELSLDASGELLYRRGWKSAAVAAPLRETVAAAVLRTIGWAPGEALLDPFCGSGTIPIEAAQRVAGIAAGRDRAFDFQRWANFRPELWAEIADRTASEPEGEPRIFGSDLDADAVAASRHNAASAGVESLCAFAEADAATLEPPPGPPGWVVTNPPWNLRLPDPNHAALNGLISRFETSFDGWRLAMITPRRWRAARGKVLAKFELGGVRVSLRVLG